MAKKKKGSILDQAIQEMAKRLDEMQKEIEREVTIKLYGENFKRHQRTKISAQLDPQKGGMMGQVFSPTGVEAWFVLHIDTEAQELKYELHHL